MTRSIDRLRTVAFWAVVVAAVPYLTLKLLWLAGSRIGMGTGGADAALMLTPRFVIGNIVTSLMDLAAILLALALLRPWGRRVPQWAVLVVAGPATGLLAPIALGLPVGGVIQIVVDGSLIVGGEDNLEGWVFATVYGGFAVMTVALVVLLAAYVAERWGRMTATGPFPPRPGLLTAGCGAVMLAFAAAMAYWGINGPGSTGPVGMDSIAQRTVLVATAALAVVGFAAPLPCHRRTTATRARLAWLCTWTGCATTALQGPAGLLLAHDGQVRPLGVVLAVAATPTAIVYWLAVWRRANAQFVALESSRVAPRTDERSGPQIPSAGSGALRPPENNKDQ